jgi:hypothetical protein
MGQPAQYKVTTAAVEITSNLHLHKDRRTAGAAAYKARGTVTVCITL